MLTEFIFRVFVMKFHFGQKEVDKREKTMMQQWRTSTLVFVKKMGSEKTGVSIKKRGAHFSLIILLFL